MPFGDELAAGTGGRTTAMGYGVADNLRQRFTGQPSDTETGLDFFSARYYASSQGRFTSTDPLQASAHPANPQTWNRYSYVLNNPLRMIDPSGMEGEGGIENDPFYGGDMNLDPQGQQQQKEPFTWYCLPYPIATKCRLASRSHAEVPRARKST